MTDTERPTTQRPTAQPPGAEPPGELLDAEDAKLVTLARGARARAGAAEGAAVRDDDGRLQRSERQRRQ